MAQKRMIDLLQFLPRHVQKHGQWQEFWVKRHKKELVDPANPFAQAYLAMLSGWLLYADAHNQRYESYLSEDYILGVAWFEIGKQLRVMLNGEIGGLDAGTMDAILIRAVSLQGFDPGEL